MTDVIDVFDVIAQTDTDRPEAALVAPATAPIEKKNQTMSLSEAGQHDYRTGAKNKKTGWGIISADRAARGVSRQARIARKAAQ